MNRHLPPEHAALNRANDHWRLTSTLPRPVRATATILLSLLLANCADDQQATAPTALESVSGPTFADVPYNHWANPYVEALFHQGYIAGCSESPRNFCPERSLIRAEMAVFVVRGVKGAAYQPPPHPRQRIFNDVDPNAWYARWVYELLQMGFTAGCGDGNFCPERTHTRAEACVFLTRVLRGSLYSPPAAQGEFSDVPPDWWGAKWVEAAFRGKLIPDFMISANKEFQPNIPILRSEAAYMLYQATLLVKFGFQVGPTNLPITNWNYDRDAERRALSRIVLTWLEYYIGQKVWYKDDRLLKPVNPRSIAGFLLQVEMGELWLIDMSEQSTTVRPEVLMARVINDDLRDGVAIGKAARYTAFFNPSWEHKTPCVLD